MSTEPYKPIIFISYAHADEPQKPAEGEIKWLSFVTGYLRPAVKQGAVEIWVDRLMRGGEDWNQEVERVWGSVSFVDVGPGPDNSVISGDAIPLRAAVDLAGLRPQDVRVEAVVGRIGTSGQLEDTQVLTLPSVEQNGSVVVFSREFVPHQTGRLGYSLRVSPNHYDDPLTRGCNPLLKWGGEAR